MKRGFLYIALLSLAVIIFTAGNNGKRVQKGETLPAWQEGYLDIHTISTGRGECLFFVLPDGTTMVVDVGEFSRESKKYRNVAQRPNAETRPTKAYGDYIRHFMPEGRDAVDYLNISHFHMDHMGNMEPEYTKAAEGDYILSGVTALYHEVPYREVIDRAYGAYDSLSVKAMSTAALANYKKFLKHHLSKGTLRASRFELGKVNQFALKYNAEAYPTFRIENICSNGYVWENGKPFNVYTSGTLRENAASCGFVIRYGKFDYLTAGDIGNYQDLEYYVAKAAGDIDAVKAHHHLSPRSMCEKAMGVMKPEVMVVTSFYEREIQPDKSKFDYILNGGCDLYCTSVAPSLIEADKASYAKCKAVQGHIVIRVAPKGKKYWVYTLDDSNTNYTVKDINGPYKSK